MQGAGGADTGAGAAADAFSSLRKTSSARGLHCNTLAFQKLDSFVVVFPAQLHYQRPFFIGG